MCGVMVESVNALVRAGHENLSTHAEGNNKNAKYNPVCRVHPDIDVFGSAFVNKAIIN
jgi:hypothetical protein